MNELNEILAGILMCEPGNLPPDATPLREIKGWDSLKHVLLVVGLEKQLKVKLTAAEIRHLVTLADVRHIMTRKSGDA
ncbi:MAG: acyl carrier protein [Chthoniobacterales bacterium]|nr:acyl carrier protein [Chthoniobacterales bacterium]